MLNIYPYCSALVMKIDNSPKISRRNFVCVEEISGDNIRVIFLENQNPNFWDVFQNNITIIYFFYYVNPGNSLNSDMLKESCIV